MRTAPRIAWALHTLLAGEYEGLCKKFCRDWNNLCTINPQNQLPKLSCRTKPNTENKALEIKVQIKKHKYKRKREKLM